jgi:hypothetical protein
MTAPPVNNNPAGLSGVLAGQPQGPLSGNSGFWDQLWPVTAGAALLAGPSLRQGLANAAAQVVPALQQDRRRAALNAWLRAKSSGGQIDPATLQLLRSDPGLGESMASTMLAPHPKQLSFDRYGRGYVFEPYSGTVQPVPQAASQASLDDGGGEVIPGVGPLVPMNRLLGRPQKIGTDASGQTLWRDQTGQVARGPAAFADLAQGRFRAVNTQLKNARDTLFRLGGIRPGDDPANIAVPDGGAGSAGLMQQWTDATNQLRDAVRMLDTMKPDEVYDDAYLPQPGDSRAVRAAKINKLNAMIDQTGTLGGG